MLMLLQLVDVVEKVIVRLSRLVVMASGIALTLVTTGNVIARYTLSGGGFSFAQELPMLIFPWFILAGIVLAAHVGGHMAVEWLYDKLGQRLRIAAFVLSSAVSASAFLVLSYQAMVVAEIAGLEHSPVLQLPNSVGYYSLAVGAFLVAIVTVSVAVRVLRFGWEQRTKVGAEEMPL
ncbi:TRAP transporter small permease [Sinorhizobium fredii]|uniref:TRAP transporter small permease n=1 Tax=Rhizobium fredii TaxID=380 RepID=UPI000560FF04|nr:TRAP transporter small permease subunit [Sinorhizobium fredii]